MLNDAFPSLESTPLRFQPPLTVQIPGSTILVESGAVDPFNILTQMEPVTSAIDAYKAFDTRRPGWIKVELTPSDPAMPAEPVGGKVLSKDSAIS